MKLLSWSVGYQNKHEIRSYCGRPSGVKSAGYTKDQYHVVRKDITIETGNRDHSDNYVIYPYIISPT